MSQYFNLTRFGHLLRKHLGEHVPGYLLGAAVLLGAQLLLLGFCTYVQHQPLSEAMQSALFMLMLLGAGCFFASTSFAQFGAGRQAALALTLPASQFEKYLLAWLVSLPGFLGVFVAEFYLADWLVMHLVSPTPGALLPLLGGHEVPGLRTFLALHGLMLWGSICFPRLAFVKTAFLGFGGALVLGIANFQWLNSWLGGQLGMAIPFGAAGLHNFGSLLLPPAQERWLVALPLALALLLWAAAYARLTEKQL